VKKTLFSCRRCFRAKRKRFSLLFFWFLHKCGAAVAKTQMQRYIFFVSSFSRRRGNEEEEEATAAAAI